MQPDEGLFTRQLPGDRFREQTDLVETIADRVTVLHQGQVLAEGSLREVQANEQVIEVYLGR